jgi:hypothetical protein
MYSYIHYVCTAIRLLSDSSGTQKKLEKLEYLVRSQEQRIRALENRPQEGVELGGGDLTEQEKKVMGYISKYPNATKQDVVDHFKGEMARVPVFNTIDRLVRYGIIEDNLDTKNRQVHRLVLNKASTFLMVLLELKQFEESFQRLVRKIKQESERIYASNPERMFASDPSRVKVKHEYFELIWLAYNIFDSMLRSYIARYMHLWSKEFHDRKDVLNKLTTIVLTRIAEIRESLPDVTVENIDYFRDVYLIYRLQGTEYLKGFVLKSEKFGLTKEMEPVLDALWNINREIQEYAYPEPRLYFWEGEGFEYGKDDWRKLLEVVKKHPDKALSKTEKMPIDGLLNKPIDILLK